MKRMIIISFTVFLVISIADFSKAEKKQEKKENPCLSDCRIEHKKCIQAAKKVKKSERKAKIAECEKIQKECDANCGKIDE